MIRVKPSSLVVVVRTKNNKNSWTALLGSLETRPSLKNLALEVWDHHPGRGWSVFRGSDAPWPDVDRPELVVGCLSFCTPEVLEVPRLVAQFRSKLLHSRARRGGRVALVVGGPHVTGRPPDVPRVGADYGVSGEGEVAFPRLLEALTSGRDPLGAQVPGLVAPAGDRGAVVVAPPGEPLDLNLAPAFCRKFVWHSPVEVSRGCFWRCAFCQTGFARGRMRHRDVDNVVEAFGWWGRRGYPHARFLSPDAFRYGARGPRELRPDKVQFLLTSVKSAPGITRVFFGSFPSEVRPDSVTASMLEAVHGRVDNWKVSLGLQVADDAFLRRLGRGHSVAQFWRAFDLLRDWGFTPVVDFIFGLPGETERVRRANLEALKAIRGTGALVRAHAFVPLPGTPLERAPPGRVDDETKRVLNRLLRRQVRGDWREQERVAWRIHEWLTAG
ncbi:MAG: TIGR04013 family B12-binding domain/radical SAM domain-containing protein [Promethearchaeota archaeon]